ncbi:Beta-lactamase [Rhodopirellula maiorica SM1]|uniref:Beta-lactamase n=1 Tax=Rhodopirellula maiorica SM1 TaxID=1265738 RepID=M5RID0_9BACT|nr:serine hydrolase domain-containing protein [Rhodopirellula maiorica]EMI19055.1 Beta-lactamase [Rhodopirellula maiorica SM1]
MKHITIPAFVASALLCFTFTNAAEPLSRPSDAIPISPDPSSDPTIAKEISSVLDPLVERFANNRDAVGTAVAVSRNGKLIYARAIGYRDLSAAAPAEPTTLFSIASVSKPITAIAVVKLVQDRKLGLDDRFIDVLQLDPSANGNDEFDTRIRAVTIRHLLNHTGGWDRTASYDPLGTSNRVRVCEHLNIAHEELHPNHIVQYMLTKPLDFDPGTKFAYSNIGYCILGRVIEKVTGETYEDYVTNEVLKPLGIQQMKLRADNPYDNEATAYTHETKNGEPIHGSFVACDLRSWPNKVVESHGGWLASAVDLSRLLAAFDSPARMRILSPNAIKAMFSPPRGLPSVRDDGSPKPNFYGFGWDIWPAQNGFTAAHGGGACGMSAYISRSVSGFNWVVLTSTDAGFPTNTTSTSLIRDGDQALANLRINSRFDLFRIRYKTAFK